MNFNSLTEGHLYRHSTRAGHVRLVVFIKFEINYINKYAYFKDLHGTPRYFDESTLARAISEI